MRNNFAAWVSIVCACACVAVVSSSCGSGHPRYIKGSAEAWVIPLIEPEAGTELIVEAYVGEQGPYLFLVNPDTAFSSIDDELAKHLGFYTRNDWRSYINQDDHRVNMRGYEVRGLRFGDLEVETVGFRSFSHGAFDVREHKIAGVLGGGVLTSVVSVDIDRDAGVLRLSKPKAENIPTGAIAIRGRTEGAALYVPAQVNGINVELRVDLGVSTSLWPHVIDEMRLPAAEITDVYTDQTGTTKLRTEGAGIYSLRIGPLELTNQTVVRFWQPHWFRSHFDHQGILGRDTLSRYHVLISYDSKTLYLAPRVAGANERI